MNVTLYTMTETEFWELTERAVKASHNDPILKLEALRKELEKLTPEAIAEYARHFDEKEAKAYRWDLWAAAHILHGGCSDDTFMDFLASLVSSGKSIYELALKNPDSLVHARFENPEEDLFFEGFQYLPGQIFEEKTGIELPDSGVTFPWRPAGKEWDEDSESDLKKICPMLYEKYYGA